MKVDIEGTEFEVFSDEEDLSRLDQVDQVVIEVHRDFGDAAAPGEPAPPARLRRAPARQRGNQGRCRIQPTLTRSNSDVHERSPREAGYLLLHLWIIL